MRKGILIAVGVLFVVGLVGAGVGYWLVFGPNTTDFEGEQGVLLPRGSGFQEVTDSLEANGLLRSRATFELVGRLTGWADQMKAGHYSFEAGASNYELLNDIRKGLQSPVRLTIPPGTRPEVVAAVAAREMAFTKEDFLAALSDPALATELDTDTTHLFGYMLPNTYHFYWLNDAPAVVRKVKGEFDAFYEREIAPKVADTNLDKGEVTALASIVEWETGLSDEKPRVAGVYLNRLRIGMALQADPTIQYALLQREGSKRRVLYADLQLDHPYNTYKFAGLPPGPITNPSPSSLRAVANAEDHDYLYFVATGDGDHTFSRTLREHNRAAQQYHSLMRERRRQQRQEAAAAGTP